MIPVKSSSHSPSCIEHSPYPPCIPTCRLMLDMERMLMEEMARPLAMDNIQVDPLYADLFKEPGTLLPKAALISNDLPQEFKPNPYLLQNPRACTNHPMSWHWKKEISCKEFDARLDETLGFTELAEDETALEARLFRIGRDDRVQEEAQKRRRAERRLTLWKRSAIASLSSAVVSWITVAGSHWWW